MKQLIFHRSHLKTMGKKFGFKSLFRREGSMPYSSSALLPPSYPFLWPSCSQPEKKLSFTKSFSTDVSAFTSSSPGHSQSLSTVSECSVMEAMRAMRSKRLLFDSDCSDNNINPTMAKATGSHDSTVDDGVPFEGGMAVVVDSEDPYGDFRVSMEEMVEACGSKKDMVWFEEMLVWYLSANDKSTHGLIIGAFEDLLSDIASNHSSTSSPCSSISGSSSCYMSCLSFSSGGNKEVVDDEGTLLDLS